MAGKPFGASIPENMCMNNTTCNKSTHRFLVIFDVDRVGKNPGAIAAKGLEVGFDPINAAIAESQGKFLSGSFMEEFSVSYQADPCPVGKRGPEFRAMVENEVVSHRRFSPLFNQDQRESICRSEMVEGDVSPPPFQGV